MQTFINKVINSSTDLKSSCLLLFVICSLSLLTGPKSWSQQQPKENPLVAVGQLEPYRIFPEQVAELAVSLNLPPGYHAYQDQFRVEVLSPAEVRVGQVHVSPVVEFYDKTSKKQRIGIEGKASLRAPVQIPKELSFGDQNLEIKIWYQACTATYCLFPQEKTLKIPFHVQSEVQSTSQKGFWSAVISGDFSAILGLGFFWGLLLTFLAGILTSLSPCIFPMIPITLAILGHRSSERTRLRNFMMSFTYVMGIALTYAALGVVAAKTGAMFGSYLGNPWVLGFTATLFFVMSVSLYGAFDLQMPNWVRQRLANTKTDTSLMGAFLAGLLAGVLASPCVGPILVGILTFVAQTQNVTYGFFYLFAYAFGIGQLFLILGLTSHVSRFLPKSGPWMNAVKFFFGTLMLTAGFYYLHLLVPPRIFDGALGIALILISSTFGAFRPNDELSGRGRLLKGIMTALLIFGALQLSLAVFNIQGFTPQALSGSLPKTEKTSAHKMDWQKWDKTRFEKALADKTPMIIDFWADWCEACKELEQKTFTDATVAELSKKFLLLKFDATTTSPELEQLRKDYKIHGLPTLLFFSNGKWVSEQTLNGFETSQDFMKRMQAVLSKP